MADELYIGIDFGTTATAAARIADGGEPELVDMEGDARSMPSAVLYREDGRPLVGRHAARSLLGQSIWGQGTPKRVLREGRQTVPFGPQRTRIGISEVVRWVLEAAYAKAIAGLELDSGTVALTCPIAWAEGGEKRRVLMMAAAGAGITNMRVISEPEAAAHHLGAHLPDGATIAVYDLGGGTCDVAILELCDGALETVAQSGEEVGEQPIGGESFDDALLHESLRRLRDDDAEAAERLQTVHDDPTWLGDSDDDAARRHALTWRKAYWELRQNVNVARELLSAEDTADILVPGTDVELAVTRTEFEGLIEEKVDRTIDLLAACVERAGRTPDVAYLVGGASATPLVREAVAAALEVEPVAATPAKGPVALGAARWIAGRSRLTGDEPAQPRRPAPEEPPGKRWGADDPREQIALALEAQEDEIPPPEDLEFASVAGAEVPGMVWDLAWTPAGDGIAVALQAGAYSMLEMPEVVIRWTKKSGLVQRPAVRAIAVSPDGEWVAMGGDGGTIEKRRRVDGESQCWIGPTVVSKGANRIHTLAFSHGGGVVASGRGDGEVKIWRDDIRDSDPKVWSELHAHGSERVNEVAFSPDDEVLYSAGGDGRVVAWAAAGDGDGEVLWEFEHERAALTLAVAARGELLLVATGSEVVVHDASSGEMTATLTGPVGDVYAVAVAPDGRLVATGSEDGSVWFYDLEDGSAVAAGQYEGNVDQLAFAPRGRVLAFRSTEPSPRLIGFFAI